MNNKELGMIAKALHNEIERMMISADWKLEHYKQYEEGTDEYVEAKKEYDEWMAKVKEHIELHQRLLVEYEKGE